MKTFKHKNVKQNSKVYTCAVNCISKDLDENINKIKSELGNSSDIVIEFFKPENYKGLRYANIYIENLVDKVSINSLSMGVLKILNPKDKLDASTPEDY